MLPKTIFEYAGIFERFGIRKKYINPEETYSPERNMGLNYLGAAHHPKDGVNTFFKRHMPPLPETLLVFADDAAFPWLGMSEGLMSVERKWLTYEDKVKFYMSLDKEPREDWELTLKGSMFDVRWLAIQQLDVRVFINNNEIGRWQADRDAKYATFTIPRVFLEESFRDETRLVTLMLRLQGVPTWVENGRQEALYGLRLEEMRIRPRAQNTFLP
jgi:hypothetical protein